MTTILKRLLNMIYDTIVESVMSVLAKSMNISALDTDALEELRGNLKDAVIYTLMMEQSALLPVLGSDYSAAIHNLKSTMRVVGKYCVVKVGNTYTSTGNKFVVSIYGNGNDFPLGDEPPLIYASDSDADIAQAINKACNLALKMYASTKLYK